MASRSPSDTSFVHHISNVIDDAFEISTSNVAIEMVPQLDETIQIQVNAKGDCVLNNAIFQDLLESDDVNGEMYAVPQSAVTVELRIEEKVDWPKREDKKFQLPSVDSETSPHPTKRRLAHRSKEVILASRRRPLTARYLDPELGKFTSRSTPKSKSKLTPLNKLAKTFSKHVARRDLALKKHVDCTKLEVSLAPEEVLLPRVCLPENVGMLIVDTSANETLLPRAYFSEKPRTKGCAKNRKTVHRNVQRLESRSENLAPAPVGRKRRRSPKDAPEAMEP
ncbi:hypothetical protein TSAR_006950 [Trichomalopsis sarcophagae]|uniref:Uncharacterized protein n=1 Tax=Trichomalopsis sarcophagae TaxID=543379 RepID=A0A232FG95_9HYME|nr:hypothetical protein TSAR_006950 [Trichomalopsis sarcophagae]